MSPLSWYTVRMENDQEYLINRMKVVDECWIWQLSTNKGYGRLYRNSRYMLAHVFAFEVFIGNRNRKLDVMHSCNNGLCINPEHLSQGTRLENNQYKVACGRQYRPSRENCNLSKLTSAQVTAILDAFDDGASKQSLADEYDVAWNTIHRLLRKNGR